MYYLIPFCDFKLYYGKGRLKNWLAQDVVCGGNESFRKFETHFNALVSKFNSHGSVICLPESITAFMLMPSAVIDDNHRVSILATAGKDLSTAKSEQVPSRQTSADIGKHVRYETVASILRQCEKRHRTLTYSQPLSVNQGKLGEGNDGGRRNGEHLHRMKCNKTCRQCRKFGHWKNDHADDGSLKPGAPCLEQPPTDSDSDGFSHTKANGSPQANPKKKPNVSLGFTSALCKSLLAGNVAQSAISDFRKVGPLVDDAAPYSAIGEMELHIIEKQVLHLPVLEPKLKIFANHDTWQYGSEDHDSQRKLILGSVEIFVKTYNDDLISICHLVIHGSSGWVVGPNITRLYTIEHIDSNALILPSESFDRISLIDVAFHSYLSIRCLIKCEQQSSPCLSCLSAASSAVELGTLDNWSKRRHVVGRVHRHTCGHASYSDMRTMLACNGL